MVRGKDSRRLDTVLPYLMHVPFHACFNANM